MCQKFRKKRTACEKGDLCAFVHYDFEIRNIPSCDKVFPFERLRKNPKQLEPWQIIFEIPNLPDVTEDELKQF
jgi:hypothetical protein